MNERKRPNVARRRLLHSFLIFVLILVIAYPLFLLPPQSSESQAASLSSSPWVATTSYPGNSSGIGTEGESCVVNSDLIYCAPGYLSSGGGSYSTSTYFGNISTSGISNWAQTTSTPSVEDGESCGIEDGYIFCVGGDSSGGYTNSAIYAPISSSGIGAWTLTTYPFYGHDISCVINSGYMYCVGGFGNSSPGQVVGSSYQSVYFASVGSSGFGTWTTTTKYPIAVSLESCVEASNQIYCIGGGNNSGPVSDVYYTTLSSSGVGAWTATTSYPMNAQALSCATDSNYVYCVGGYNSSLSPMNKVYYAPITSTGLSAWSEAPNYPLTISVTACVIYSGSIYCLGGQYGSQNMPYNGYTSDVYYTQLGALTGTTPTSTTSQAFFTSQSSNSNSKSVSESVSQSSSNSSTIVGFVLPPSLQPYAPLITIGVLFASGLLIGIGIKKALVGAILVIAGLFVASFSGLAIPILGPTFIVSHLLDIMKSQLNDLGPIFFTFPIFWIIGFAVGIWKG